LRPCGPSINNPPPQWLDGTGQHDRPTRTPFRARQAHQRHRRAHIAALSNATAGNLRCRGLPAGPATSPAMTRRTMVMAARSPVVVWRSLRVISNVSASDLLRLTRTRANGIFRECWKRHGRGGLNGGISCFFRTTPRRSNSTTAHTADHGAFLHRGSPPRARLHLGKRVRRGAPCAVVAACLKPCSTTLCPASPSARASSRAVRVRRRSCAGPLCRFGASRSTRLAALSVRSSPAARCRGIS
jgi:hypothetical protein